MGFSITHLLVVLAIAIVVFGTRRLRDIGADLGGAIKGFRNAMKEGEDSISKVTSQSDGGHANTIEGEVTSNKDDKG